MLKGFNKIMYSTFLEEDFTVKHTIKTGNGVPWDQVLKKEY